MDHLRDDLASGEAAVEAHLPRGAERAAICAACLGGDADRRAGAALARRGIEHQHGLDEPPVTQLQQQLARAPVLREQFRAHTWAVNAGLGAQPFTQGRGQVRHRVEVGRKAAVDPIRYLARAEGFLAPTSEKIG